MLEIRVSDVRDERGGGYLCSPSVAAGLASRGSQTGLCWAGFAGDGHRQSLAGRKGCRRFCGLFHLGSVGLVDVDSHAEPEGNVCLKTCPLTSGSPGLFPVRAAGTEVACGLRSPQVLPCLCR